MHKIVEKMVQLYDYEPCSIGTQHFHTDIKIEIVFFLNVKYKL